MNKVWNKIPLTLLLASQSFNAGLWNYFELEHKLPITLNWLAIVVSVVMGLSIDLAIVSTALGKTRKTKWSWAALVVMSTGTAAIVLALYAWNILHIFYAAGCLLYSLHLLFGSSDSLGTIDDALPVEALFECPHCHTSLKNKQSLASARSLGYCKNCKEKSNDI